MAKVKPDGHIWGLKFNRYVCFSFHANQTILGWDIANYIFDLEKFKVKVKAKVKADGHIWGLEFNQYVCLSLQSDHFWLRYSKFNVWSWKFKVKVMAKVKLDGHIWGLEFNQYVCFLFHGKRWPWKFKVKVTTKINQNLIR